MHRIQIKVYDRSGRKIYMGEAPVHDQQVDRLLKILRRVMDRLFGLARKERQHGV